MTRFPQTDADPEVHPRIRQQEVVTEIGQQPLETDDLDQLMHDAAAAVAETLGNEYAKVLELLPGGDDVFLRQGVGWRDGLVENATVPTDLDSQAGYTLISEHPIIVDDLRTEDRFSGPELLTSHDVVSGISVIIGSIEEPWGVLGTHTTEKREFTEHDANFVQSIANVLAAAIEETETKRRLREREAELKEVYGRVSDGFIALNREWEFTHVNERAAEILDSDKGELLGSNIWSCFPALVGTEFEADYRKAMATQEPVSIEEYYSPYETWFEERIFPSESGLSIYIRDITDQKHLEQELEKTFDRITDAFIGLDADWEITYVNDHGKELLDPQDRGLVGENFWDPFEPALGTTFEEEYREAMQTQESTSFEEYYPPLGIWFEVHAYPSESGLSIYFRDITERKEREQKLEESERRYRTLAEHFPNGIVALFDEDLRYTLAAGEAFDEFPISAEYAEGRYVQDVWPDQVSDAVEPAFRAALDGEKRAVELEYNDREWIVHVVPITDESDNVFGGMTIAQDITEHKEMQRKFKESNERLEQFAYAASHDLQEPLRMVTSYLQLLENRYSEAFDEDGREFLEFAIDGAERMSEMIDGLLEYSRVDTQGDSFEPFDLDDVVDDVIEDLQIPIMESNARIEGDSLPRVCGDVSQLRQVLQNLVSNAITYSGDEPPEIHVEADRRGRKWVISVHDEGIGIDPDEQERVFEVFQRLHSQEEHVGTGIGLALCRRIIERHGGRIWVDSEPGEGATFSFTLPATTE